MSEHGVYPHVFQILKLQPSVSGKYSQALAITQWNEVIACTHDMKLHLYGIDLYQVFGNAVNTTSDIEWQHYVDIPSQQQTELFSTTTIAP